MLETPKASLRGFNPHSEVWIELTSYDTEICMGEKVISLLRNISANESKVYGRMEFYRNGRNILLFRGTYSLLRCFLMYHFISISFIYKKRKKPNWFPRTSLQTQFSALLLFWIRSKIMGTIFQIEEEVFCWCFCIFREGEFEYAKILPLNIN